VRVLSVAGDSCVSAGQRCGLGALVGQRASIGEPGRPCLKGNPGVNAEAKMPVVVAGMLTGADSIDDMDLLRHSGMKSLFAGVYAPSSLGSQLRAYTYGHVRQLESAARSPRQQVIAAQQARPRRSAKARMWLTSLGGSRTSKSKPISPTWRPTPRGTNGEARARDDAARQHGNRRSRDR
jgi:hypothetical protein